MPRNCAHRFIYLLITLTLGACAGQQVAKTDTIQKKAAKVAEKRVISNAEALALAEESLQQAEDENLLFFAPLHLQQAKDAYNSALELSRTPDSARPNGTIEDALAARQFIEQGINNKSDVLVYLKEAIAHKRVLQQLEVPTLYRESYAEVLNGFAKLIRLIEEGEADEALNKQKPLRKNMYDLEVDALLHIHLREAKRILAEAETHDAESYAPFSYHNAAHKIQAAERYTRSNYRDTKQIEKNGLVATDLARQALEIVIEAKKLSAMDNEALEQYVLDIQKHLQKYSQSLSGKNMPPQSLQRSFQEVLNNISELQRDLSTQVKKTEQLEMELQRYSAVEISPMKENDASQVQVLKIMEKEAMSEAPPLQEDEQSFDSVEYVE